VPGQEEYPTIGDYALIGDCRSAALVSRALAIEWCCLPRFDSGSAFGAMLDRERGGTCSITPKAAGEWRQSRSYLDDTMVLASTLDGPDGELTVLDLFLIAQSESEVERRLVRVIEGRRGAVELDLRVAPRFDYGHIRPWVRRLGTRIYSAVGGNDALVIWCEQELGEDPAHELSASFTVSAGDRVHLLLSYQRPEVLDNQGVKEPGAHEIDARIEETIAWWRKWAQSVTLHGRDEAPARRSALVLKALTHEPTGAVVAAPTTGLP
jgi:GH15 family glucan-1,4-alpha-glucosidase